MRDLNPKVSHDGRGSFCSKCLFSHLLILSTILVFHRFLSMKTSNKNYLLKNESVYRFCKFQENAPFLQSLVECGFLFCLYYACLQNFEKLVLALSCLSICTEQLVSH